MKKIKILAPFNRLKAKIPPKVNKGIKIGVGALTGIIVLLIVYMLVCNVIAVREEKPVSYFGYSYSYVPTSSMEPAIKKGDSIIFKKVSYDSCDVGDIIIYKSKADNTKGMYIVHRIIEITDEGFIVQGDNNPTPDDEVITKDMIIGRYIKTFNFLNVGKLATNRNLIYGLLITVFLIIIVTESINIYLMKNKRMLKKNKADISEEELKAQVLQEMKEELLREIEEENKKKEDEN